MSFLQDKTVIFAFIAALFVGKGLCGNCAAQQNCSSCIITKQKVGWQTNWCRWCEWDRKCYTYQAGTSNPCNLRKNGVEVLGKSILHNGVCPGNEIPYDPSFAWKLLSMLSLVELPVASNLLNCGDTGTYNDTEKIQQLFGATGIQVTIENRYSVECDESASQSLWPPNKCFGVVAKSSSSSQNPPFIYLGFRGASSICQIFAVLFGTVIPTATPGVLHGPWNGRIHKLFDIGFKALWHDSGMRTNAVNLIQNNSGHDVYIAGGSLGGVWAALAALDLATTTGLPNIGTRIKFTSAISLRIGDANFASAFARHVKHSFRLTLKDDIISQWPPLLFGSYHFPNEVWYQSLTANISDSMQFTDPASYKECKKGPLWGEDLQCSSGLGTYSFFPHFGVNLGPWNLGIGKK